MNPLLGVDGPAVVVPARIAAIIERYGNLTELRVRTRGVDPEASEVLAALRLAAMSWRDHTSATGSAVAPEPEVDPALQWLATTEAADVLGVTDRAVRLACADGRLDSQRVAGRYRVTREAVEHFRAIRTA